MLKSWSVSKSKHTCCRCGGEFAEGCSFYSCLIEEQADLARRDFCADCWDIRAPDEVFCHWRTRRVPARRKQVVDTELMLDLFGRLECADTDKKRTMRFVLALYLMRRKELKLLETGRGDGNRESLSFECRSSGGKVEVQSPCLTEEQIQQASADLSRLLNACL